MAQPDVTKERPKDKQQVAAFRKAARELDANESKEGFQSVLRTLAKAKPSPEKSKSKGSASRGD